MEPIWVVIFGMAMDERMLRASTTPCCLLASRACTFPKDGGISLKVCGNLSMDPAKSFGAFAKKFSELGAGPAESSGGKADQPAESGKHARVGRQR